MEKLSQFWFSPKSCKLRVASLRSSYGTCNGDKGGRRQTPLRKQVLVEGRCQAGEEQKSGNTLRILTHPEEEMGSWWGSEQHWGPSHMGDERQSYANPEVQDSSSRPEGSIRPAEDSVLPCASPPPGGFWLPLEATTLHQTGQTGQLGFRESVTKLQK